MELQHSWQLVLNLDLIAKPCCVFFHESDCCHYFDSTLYQFFGLLASALNLSENSVIIIKCIVISRDTCNVAQ